MATQYETAKQIATEEARIKGKPRAEPEDIAKAFMDIWQRAYDPTWTQSANVPMPTVSGFSILGQKRRKGGQENPDGELCRGLRQDFPWLRIVDLTKILKDLDKVYGEDQISKFLARKSRNS